MPKHSFKYLFCFSILSLSLIGCVHKKKTQAQADKTIAEETPQIVFLTFSIAKDTTNKTIAVNLKSKTVVNGKFKDQEQVSAKSLPNYLTLVFGNGSKAQKTIYLEHPLYKRVDVYGEKGEIESKEIRLSSSEFNLRVEKQKGINTVNITEIVNFKETKTNLSLKLD